MMMTAGTLAGKWISAKCNKKMAFVCGYPAVGLTQMEQEQYIFPKEVEGRNFYNDIISRFFDKELFEQHGTQRKAIGQHGTQRKAINTVGIL